MLKDNPKHLKKVENILNAAEEAIQEMEVKKNGTTEITLAPGAYEIEEVENIGNPEVIFTLGELKKDFILTRRNLKKLVRQGQRLMDSLEHADLEDLKGAQIVAIAQLSDTIGRQLKLMIEVYKDITEIEKNMRPSMLPEGTIIKGNVTNQAIYVGNSAELLKHLNKKE